MKARVLIVDDEPGMVSSCVEVLESGTDGFVPDIEIETASSGKAALDALRRKPCDLLITDLRMDGMDGLELLEFARARDPSLMVIVMTAFPTLETAAAATQEDGVDYIVKPFTAQQLRLVVGRCLTQQTLRRENRWLRQQLARSVNEGGIVGTSALMQQLLTFVQRVARSDSSILILGDTGTGKTLVARAIHDASPRKEKPFVQIDCGSFPDHLLESELFGHEKGAFTGAHERRRGLIECAGGGTFFLDEICELPLPLQSKLLGVLQERTFRRIGGRELIEVHARILAATNQDIEARVAAGKFREDLFYRLNVIQLKVPPLRDHLEDVALLATHFLNSFNRRNGTATRGITPRALARLQEYNWPGNVRELENVIERAAALTLHALVDTEDLPEHLSGSGRSGEQRVASSFAEEREDHIRRFERAFLENLLKETSGNVMEAARQAGLPRTTIYRYLDKYRLDPRAFR